MVSLLVFFGFVFFASGIGLIVWKYSKYIKAKEGKTSRRSRDYGEEEVEVVPIKRPSIFGNVILALIGLTMLVILLSGGATQVPATHVAVVENTVRGQFYSIGPGTHIWPFSWNLVPFVTKVYKYSLRKQLIEIGEPPKDVVIPEGKSATQVYGVPSASNSPGQPIVFIRGRGWASPNPEKIIQLHRRYGPDYLNFWVEAQWISTVKAVQGQQQYDYLKTSRVTMQGKVEENLQGQLTDIDEGNIVEVSQLAVVDYDYESDVNEFLKKVAEMEFGRQQVEQQIEINTKTQLADTIDAETKYIVTKRGAEAEQAKLIAEATGRAESTKLEGDADAYRIMVKYQAESEGIQLVQSALAASPDSYLEYQRTLQWDGKLPVYMFGDAVLPFVNIPGQSQSLQ